MSNKKTFQDIIKDNKVEIPIIQRDYVQGRESNKVEKIREEFLNAILNALKDDKPLNLDFIYGREEEKTKKFIPLDGQQRLTTLFLLHWYFVKKEGNHENEKFLRFENGDSRFTYETRATSREFCNKIIDFEINFEGESISEQIKDSALFLDFWKKDPTIKSILKMIDAIHKKFQKIENGFERLNNISFQFFPMQNFNLTDDLYIKMNARGKSLTPFENFKAKFIQHIKKKGL